MDTTILEQQIKALKELVAIQEQTIQALKARPLQPYQWTYHYGYPYSYQYIPTTFTNTAGIAAGQAITTASTNNAGSCATVGNIGIAR